MPPFKPDKAPRTERGRRTLRKLLDAAAIEFGERGFHDASISGITRRAGTALGSFYTYFDSKEEIFQALVRYMSEQLRDHVTPLVQAAPDEISAEGDAFGDLLPCADATACEQMHILAAEFGAGGDFEGSARFGPAWAEVKFGAHGIVYFDPFSYQVSAYARIAAGITIDWRRHALFVV